MKGIDSDQVGVVTDAPFNYWVFMRDGGWRNFVPLALFLAGTFVFVVIARHVQYYLKVRAETVEVFILKEPIRRGGIGFRFYTPNGHLTYVDNGFDGTLDSVVELNSEGTRTTTAQDVGSLLWQRFCERYELARDRAASQ